MTVDISAIKAANPLHEIVERLTGERIVRHKIRCPFHADDSPSLHVYDDGGWKCFGCGKHGDVIDFIGYFRYGQQYRPDLHFGDVVDSLGALDIKPLPTTTTRPKPAKPKLTIDLDDILAWHFDMPDSRRQYWHGRGLDDNTINTFLLGFDGKRYTIPALYRGIPFGVKRRQSDVNDGIDAKYVSVAGSRTGLFNADVLWTAPDVVICEGEIDAMLLQQHGYNAVSSTGGAGTWKPEWVHLFAGVERIAILYDNDAPGREGAAKVHMTLRRARVVQLPDGIKDVGELFAGYRGPVSWLYANVW